MNLSHIILWYIFIVTVAGKPKRLIEFSENFRDFNFDKFSLKIKINDKIQIINLIRTNGILANKFLPTWITSNKNDEQLRKLNIMDELGNFTMYHDYCTKTAIVYFHKWNRIDGVINVNYYIRGLPFNKINQVHSVKSKYIHFRNNEMNYANIDLYQFNYKYMKIQPDLNISGRNLYPELLIATSYDLHKAIEKNSQWSLGVKTVLHVIIEYNAVDMMFQMVKSVKIELNISGIIIEGTKNKWGFENKRKKDTYYINSEKLNLKISNYIQRKDNYFSRDAYDFIIYNTKKRLMDSSAGKLDGKASFTNLGVSFPPFSSFHRLNIAVKNDITHQYYTTIVRKLSYLITATDDDDGPTSYLINIMACKKTIASSQTNNSCQTSCLQWSEYAEQGFKNSLKSPAHCDLINYPRSLSQQKPRIIFSKDKQCQCYGYISHIESDVYTPEDTCNKSMYCRIKNPKKVATAPMPIDGTPCGQNKVCWNSTCVSYDKR